MKKILSLLFLLFCSTALQAQYEPHGLYGLSSSGWTMLSAAANGVGLQAPPSVGAYGFNAGTNLWYPLAVDSSGNLVSGSIPTGASLPATCTSSPMRVYGLVSGGTTTPYYCSATNTWTAFSGGGGGPYLPLTGGTLTGAITLPGNATSALQAVPLQQLNAQYEFNLRNAGSSTYTHGLGTLYPAATCYTKSGAIFQPGYLAPVDTNNITYTTPAATDTVCTFSYSSAAPASRQISITPVTNTIVPAMGSTNPAVYNITQTAGSGYTATNTYSVSGVPSPVTSAFSSSTISGSGTSTLTLSVPVTSTTALSTLTATATDSNSTQSYPLTLNVQNSLNANMLEGWAMNDGSGSNFANAFTSDNCTISSGSGSWGSATGLTGTFFNFANTGTNNAICSNYTNTNFDGSTSFTVTLWVTNVVSTGGGYNMIMSDINGAGKSTIT